MITKHMCVPTPIPTLRHMCVANADASNTLLLFCLKYTLTFFLPKLALIISETLVLTHQVDFTASHSPLGNAQTRQSLK